MSLLDRVRTKGELGEEEAGRPSANGAATLRPPLPAAPPAEATDGAPAGGAAGARRNVATRGYGVRATTDAATGRPILRVGRMAAAPPAPAGRPAASPAGSSDEEGPGEDRGAQPAGWRERRLLAGATPATTERKPYQPAQYAVVKSRVTQALLDEYTDIDQVAREKLLAKIAELTATALEEQGISITRQDRQRMVEQLASDVLGLGPLEALLKDPDISEIMINGPSRVYVERRGRIEPSPLTFESTEHLMQIIDRIVSTIGRRVDESSPMVDARLRDGSRVNVIIPPLALRGPTMTIRRFATDPLTIDNLLQSGSLTDPMATFLRACVRGRLNVLVSGGTGSGKTTTLNVLSSWIPEDERIVTIEDAAELQLRQEHVVTLEARPANVEGRGRITIRDLVVNSLRMRPDRIVIGECRGGEALDMLQAMNTGHDGSLTTIHANSPTDAMSRLETLVLMAGTDLPSRAIREQIASAINIVVQQARLRDGTRRIVAISEVEGFDGERLRLAEVFSYHQRGLDEEGRVLGEHRVTARPRVLDHLASVGEPVDPAIFASVKAAGGHAA
ncbi:MAG TPA: CpaF family protein [Candidatus Micrarchaeia archaeon]|nr:CpaF family protein [Candidatus Micrarchaeia archaeon]